MSNAKRLAVFFIIVGVFWIIGGFFSGIEHSIFDGFVLAVPGAGLTLAGVLEFIKENKVN